MMRIILAALLFAAACLPAAAQSSTATTGTTTKPMQTAPSSVAQPKATPVSRRQDLAVYGLQSADFGLRSTVSGPIAQR